MFYDVNHTCLGTVWNLLFKTDTFKRFISIFMLQNFTQKVRIFPEQYIVYEVFLLTATLY